MVKYVGIITSLVNIGDIAKNSAAANWAGAGAYVDIAADLAPLMTRLGLSKLKGEFVTSANILEITHSIISVLQALNGFGSPGGLGVFDDGKAAFDQIHDKLAAAFPTENWKGDASNAYADKNETLQKLLVDIAAADKSIADVLRTQADDVNLARNGLAGTKAAVSAALVFIIALIIMNPFYVRTFAGMQFVQRFQMGVSGAAIATALGLIGYLGERGYENAEAIEKANDTYNYVITEAKAAAARKTTVDAPQVPAASETTVGGFPEIANPSGMPDTSRLAGAAGRARDEGTLGTDAERRAAGAPTPPVPGPAAPDGTPTPAPRSTMPTLAQLAQISGQSTNIPGQFSNRSNLGGPTVGQTQRAATTPAEPDAPADEADAAGAAVGTEAVERAPVGAAAPRATQTHEPKPAQ